jgi:hypothetical protein
MAKPTELPRWGTDQTNEVTPSSQQQDEGWSDGQTAVSSYANWYLRINYDWTAWLDTIVAPAEGSESLSINAAGELAADGAHGPKTLLINPREAVTFAAGLSLSGDAIEWSNENGIAMIRLNPHVGDQILSAAFFVEENDDPINVAMSLVRIPRDDTANPVTIDSVGDNVTGEIVLDEIDHVVQAGSSYRLMFSVGTSFSDSPRVTQIAVTYDRPSPA